jgi:hypothetical protein
MLMKAQQLRIRARKLLDIPSEQLWDFLTGSFTLIFDDNEEVETNWRETVYSSYAWDFHRQYPNTPLLKKHHVRTILGKKRLGSGTHLDLLGNCMWSVYETYRSTVTRDVLAAKIYELTNKIYNEMSHRCEEYVASMDILDWLEVLDHPKIMAMKEAVAPAIHKSPDEGARMIKEAYAVIDDVLGNGIDLPRNPVSLALRSKLVNANQVQQSIGPRGYLTDINSNQFRYPIIPGYVEGIRTLYDSVIESRSAAKALQFSKSPLQEAEYFSRRLQLMCQTVRHLHQDCDCGTREYLRWQVRGVEFSDEGDVSFAGDLPLLVGKYYLDDESGKLKAITGHETHLIGKSIKLRSVLHCAHPDPYGICSTCFGELSLSVLDNRTNIGHMCCTSMAQKSSQSVLSVKHLDSSAAVEPISLTPEEKKLFRISNDGMSYILADRLKGKSVKLVIPAMYAPNITDVMANHNVDDLNIRQVSEMREVGVIVKDGNVEYPVERVKTFQNRRLASMTYVMLRHIRKVGWDFNANNDYVIDMTGWDWNEPVMTLPLIHFNMSDHSKDIASMLESSKKQMEERDKMAASVDAFCVELYNLVNDKLTVNLAVIEVVLYGAMIISAEKDDYRLPKPWTDRGLGVMDMTMDRRSLSATMAYEGHYDVFISPESYTKKNRPDHPMDAILLPQEVLGTGV